MTITFRSIYGNVIYVLELIIIFKSYWNNIKPNIIGIDSIVL